MSGIPDDVLAAAKRAAYAVEGTHEEGWITSSNGVDVIARAILVERERCAEVAEKCGPVTQDWAGDIGHDVATDIASAIRASAAHG